LVTVILKSNKLVAVVRYAFIAVEYGAALRFNGKDGVGDGR